MYLIIPDFYFQKGDDFSRELCNTEGNPDGLSLKITPGEEKIMAFKVNVRRAYY